MPDSSAQNPRSAAFVPVNPQGSFHAPNRQGGPSFGGQLPPGAQVDDNGQVWLPVQSGGTNAAVWVVLGAFVLVAMMSFTVISTVAALSSRVAATFNKVTGTLPEYEPSGVAVQDTGGTPQTFVAICGPTKYDVSLQGCQAENVRFAYFAFAPEGSREAKLGYCQARLPLEFDPAGKVGLEGDGRLCYWSLNP